MVVNRYGNHVLCIFNLRPALYSCCVLLQNFPLQTIYKYTLFITTPPYRITPKHVITLTVKCPNMENQTLCKFRSNIKHTCILNTIRIRFNTTLIKIKLYCWAVSTQIDILIQRYLHKLSKKSSVKHVHMDSNITLNIQPFQVGLIAVLSGRCHFSDLVKFDVSKPLFRFTSLHKVHAPTMVL